MALPTMPANQTVLSAYVDGNSIIGDGSIGNPMRVNVAGFDVPIPYVDLSRAPYNVVAGDNTAARANALAVEQAIIDFNGTGAWLMFPSGDVYLDAPRPGENYCILVSNGVSRLGFAGWGMHATRLVQFGQGDFGEWDLFVIDNATDIGIANLTMLQDTIIDPDPGQQNHLLVLSNNVPGNVTRDIDIVNVGFEKCIGDAFRFVSNAPPEVVESVRATNIRMRCAGVVTSVPPNGRIGARSGIAVQRGVSNATFTNVDIEGTQNQQIDFEPTGVNVVDNIRFFNVRCDNTKGSLTGQPVALAGNVALQATNIVVDGMEVIGGQLNIAFTTNAKIKNVIVRSTEPFPADPTNSSLSLRGLNDGIELTGITVDRGGTTTAGIGLDIEGSSGASGMTVRDLTVLQATGAEPVQLDGVDNFTLDGFEVVYTGPIPIGRVGCAFNSVIANTDNIQVSNGRVMSPGGLLGAAIQLLVRAPRAMRRISVQNVQSQEQASRSVLYSVGAGATFDDKPLWTGLQNGAGDTWRAENAGGAAINTVFPVVSGNSGGNAGGDRGSLNMEGFGSPAMAAPNGSTYRKLDAGGVPLTTFWVMVGGVWVGVV